MARHRSDPASRGAFPLFVAFALVSLVPVIVLGVALAWSYRAQASQRGLSEGETKAALFAHSAIEPLLSGTDIGRGLSSAQTAELDRIISGAIADGQIVRFRIRSLDGTIKYASDDSRDDEVDDEALEAAQGKTVAEITHLDADDNGHGTGVLGERVAEVYRPLHNDATEVPDGVLELYLPYDPIAADVETGLHSLYRDLAIGLGLLYLVLAGISYSATRRLRAQVQRNAYLADHDQLTGLPNRRAFEVQLERTLTRSRAEESAFVSAVILDIDRFKEVNDALGPDNGDRLLRQLGGRLTDCALPDEFVARLGGDEFGLILGPGSSAHVSQALDRFRDASSREIDLDGLPLLIETSIGVASAPRDGVDAKTLSQRADVAMYAAKQAGVGLSHYNRQDDGYDAARLALAGDVQRAIIRGELFLSYQPKIDLRTGVLKSVEALVRWNHPDRGLLMPDSFLPVIEQTRVIDPLTDWVLDTALVWAASVPAAASGAGVAINVSARNLVHADFADRVLSKARAHHVETERVTIEITETALIADRQRAEVSLTRLAQAGVRVSIDDFGQGQTSLSHLSTMPLSEVKIDKAFVTDMDRDESHEAIVRSVIELAHNLGFEVVAEGVETADVFARLQAAGCDWAQGYLIARPLTADRLEGWLNEQTVLRRALDPS